MLLQFSPTYSNNQKARPLFNLGWCFSDSKAAAEHFRNNAGSKFT